MTNREYLNSLPDDRFTEVVYSIITETENAKFKPSYTPQENFSRIKSAIKDWLLEEHKEN